jgi:integrase/recombinase XerD
VDDAELRALLAAQARLITELSERIAPTRPVLPLRVMYNMYEAAQRARRGWRTAAAMLSPFVAMFAARDVSSLQVADWTAYRVSRADLKASSLNYTMHALKAMLRWGKTEGHLDAVPQLCEARRQPAKAHRETAPTETDVGKLLAETNRARDRVIILCACDAGMRNSEIRLLERSWVDRARLEIRLPESITKTRKSRVVPITRRLLAAIDAVPRDIRSPLVLVSPQTGGPYCQDLLLRVFQRLAELAGVKSAPGEGKVRLHDGRHSAATRMAEFGVRIEVIQQILGHTSLERTRAYVQRRSGDLDAARELLERGIKNDRG